MGFRHQNNGSHGGIANIFRARLLDPSLPEPEVGGTMRHLSRLLPLLAFLCGMPFHVASADVIYSNFTAIGAGGYFVGGPDVPTPPFAPTQQAMPFLVIASTGCTGFVLTAVEVPVEWAGYGPNEVRVSIYDDGGGHPGSELDHAIVSGTELTASVASAVMSGGVVLPAGGPYWVVLYGVGAAEFVWAPGSPATHSGVALYRDPVAGTPWTNPIGDLDLAFRVFGAADCPVGAEPLVWGAVKSLFR